MIAHEIAKTLTEHFLFREGFFHFKISEMPLVSPDDQSNYFPDGFSCNCVGGRKRGRLDSAL
jgi:hypothetical protein